MSNVVALRKLTLKSKINFGKYAEHTVGSLIEANPYYLVWLYYNADRISFVDEVMDMLIARFPKFVWISKPGKEPELVDPVCKPILKPRRITFSNMSYIELKNIITALKMNNKEIPIPLLEYFRARRSERYNASKVKRVYCKRSLQAKNHGR